MGDQRELHGRAHSVPTRRASDLTSAPSRRTAARSSVWVSENAIARRGAVVSAFDSDEFIPEAYTPESGSREKRPPCPAGAAPGTMLSTRTRGKIGRAHV